MSEYSNVSLAVQPQKDLGQIYIAILGDGKIIAWMTFVSAEQADTAIQLLTAARAAVWDPIPGAALRKLRTQDAIKKARES